MCRETNIEMAEETNLISNDNLNQKGEIMIKTIKITKDQKRFLKQFIEEGHTALTGMNIFTQKYQKAQENLWEQAAKLFPELPIDHKKARPTMDHPDKGDWLITYFDEE